LWLHPPLILRSCSMFPLCSLYVSFTLPCCIIYTSTSQGSQSISISISALIARDFHPGHGNGFGFPALNLKPKQQQ
jgi:hypothetical protein